MRLRDRLELTRRTHDIASIMGVSKRKMICPFPGHLHANNTASFSIFFRDGVQWFKCHGNCGAQGDVIDFIGYMHIPGYDPHETRMKIDALDLLERDTEVHFVIPEKEVKLSKNEWHRFLPISEEGLTYIKGRGLNETTLIKFKVGSMGKWLTFPCFEYGELVGIKLRNTTDQGDRFMALKGSRQGLFNFDAVNLTSDPVLVLKGEIPCMLVEQIGFLCCAPTGGEGSTAIANKIKSALQFAKKIVVGDNDAPGRKLGKIRAEMLEGKLVFPPPEWQDIDKMILGMGASDAGNMIRSWLEDV
jgi:hypothetical protein